MRDRVYKTLGSSVNYSPMFPSYLDVSGRIYDLKLHYSIGWFKNYGWLLLNIDWLCLSVFQNYRNRSSTPINRQILIKLSESM